MSTIENGKWALESSANERRLTARFQAGEPEALTVLFELHVDRVFAYAFHLLRNREDAEEVTSEAFLRAFERASGYRAECPFRGWLFGIVRNLCFDRLREPRLNLILADVTERMGDGGAGSHQMETALAVRTALDELSHDYQVVLRLCDIEQWDASEAAFMLEKSIPATKSLLYRARRALKERLAALWSDEDSVQP